MNLANRLVELIEDWNYLIDRSGLWRVLPTIFQEITKLPYRHLKFYILHRSLSDAFPDIPAKIVLIIRPFKQSDLQLIEEIVRPSEVRQSQRHLDNGHKGLIALYQDQPVGYAWGSADINPEIEKVPIKLEPGDVLLTDVFTSPPFRGKGVQTALSLARFQMFRELGFQRAICYIEIYNAPSLAVWQRKLGVQKAGSIDFLRIGLWYKVRFKTPEFEQTSANQKADKSIRPKRD